MTLVIWFVWLVMWIVAIVIMAEYWDASTGLKALVGLVIASIGLRVQASIASQLKQ